MSKNNIKYLIAVVLILVIGITLRVVKWPNAISEINCDEAMTAINAKAMAEHGVDMYGTSYPVYLEAWGQEAGQSAMLMYIMALCIKIFGFNIFAIRLPMLIVSIISLIVMYDLIRRIFSKKTALIVLTFLSIAPWHIMQSRWSIDCNMFPHFMLFATYFLYRGITEKKAYLYISMVLYALTMYTYGVSLYFIPIFLIIMAIYLTLKKKVTIKELIICILIYILLSLPIYLMAIINLFGLQDISIGKITIQYFPSSERLEDMLIFSNNIIRTYLINVIVLIRTIIVQSDLPWNSIPQFGAIYHISLIFFIIGMIAINKKEKENNKELTKEKIGTSIILIWLLLSFITGIFINDANINRINIIWYPIIIIAGLGIKYIIDKIKYKKIAILVLSIIYLTLTILFVYTYFSTWTSTIDNAGFWSNGLTDAIKYADELETDKIYILQNKYLDSKKRTETFIEYGLNLDYTYYTLNKPMYKNNKELLPFNERYNIVEKLDKPEDIIILRQIDLKTIKNIIEEDKYNKTAYGQYVVLELKKE